MKILSVSLHVAQNIGGQVAGTINAEKHFIDIEETDRGVLFTKKGCRKLVPWSNIQGIDYYAEDGSVTVVPTR